MDSFFGTDTSPSSADSSPVIMRKIVVLPAPFGPTRPTFSPGLSWKDVSTKRTCRPYCLLMRERDSTKIAVYSHGDGDPVSEQEEDFATLFEASTARARRFERGQTIDGTIVAIGAEVALVSVGGKSEAEIDI